MKIVTILLFFAIAPGAESFAQATFQSAASGSWNTPATWTRVSGTSTTNYPVAGDTANIVSANTITVTANAACEQVSINGGAALLLATPAVTLSINSSLGMSGAASLTINQGFVTVTGSMTIGAASTVTINQGALTVIGLVLLNSPGAPAGTTLLDVEGGAFSCAGGLNISATTIPAGRFAELRIGNSAVNIAGVLNTITANAKINFTGAGTLTIAALVNIAVATSFTAGTGRVIYFGIPGSDQVVAPLVYNRLSIAGVGNGIKKINGTVSVTDTLALITDTLVIISPGILSIGANTTIVKTAGKLISRPSFAGKTDLVYNNIVRDTMGLEMPASDTVLQNLTIDDIAGITLDTTITVNHNLALQQGALLTGSDTIKIASATGNTTIDSAITVGNGYVNGIITRSIGTTAGIRVFPFGISLSQGNRQFQLNYTTAPTAGGTITARHFNSAAPAQSGLPLADGSVLIVNTAPMYWQADAGNGLSGGTYTLTLTAAGTPGVTDLSTLRIIKRPPAGGAWVTNGTAGVNTGTLTVPVVERDGMSGFSQFTFGGNSSNPLPINLLYFSGKITGQGVVLSWTTASENGNAYFDIEHSADGQAFTKIGQLKGAGNTPLQTNYTFTDSHVINGTNYYRLKQFDIGGNYAFSAVVPVKMISTTKLKLFPTNATRQLMVEYNGTASLNLYNFSGQFIKKVLPGVNDVTHLGKGVYIITDGDKNALQFIKE